MAVSLDHLTLPDGLSQLSIKQLETLCQEIRERLIQISDTCGGHLASNLGVVELTVALHTLFNSPIDRLVFDTSHQTYVHKMLTGRLNRMFTIRQDNGLAGFAKIDESEHDQFGAGHASTALSAALGMAVARNIQHATYHVVAIFGDASLSGGMAFEAMNNVECLGNTNFIGILNDNDMSISHPVGTMADTITRIRTSPTYKDIRQRVDSLLKRVPGIGHPMNQTIDRLIQRLRDIVIPEKVGVIFEEFGFKYIGPIDGHNLPMLIIALRYAKAYPGPVLIHVITKKGKGLPEAENDPVHFHGIAPKSNSPQAKPATFTSVFGKETEAMMGEHPDLVVITPAMTGGSGLTQVAKAFKDRFFDVGIAEEHAVTFAAGLARAGVKPLLAIYSTFLQRGYDQVLHDVCIQDLPVMMALDRAGLVGEDGPTHHGVFDIAYLLPLPNMVLMAPKDGSELKAMMRWALTCPHPVAYRYSKEAIAPDDHGQAAPIVIGQAESMGRWGTDTQNKVAILAYGAMVWPAVHAAIALHDLHGLTVEVVNLRFAKPIDWATVESVATRSEHVIVAEEGVQKGGLFSEITAHMIQRSAAHWHAIAVPDTFITHGKLSTLRTGLFMTDTSMVSRIMSWVTP